MRWGLVQDDTGLWLPKLGLQMQEGSFVLAAVLTGWLLLLQSVAGLVQDILKQSEPVGVGLVLGSSVQHVVAELMLIYLLHFGCVAHLEVYS